MKKSDRSVLTSGPIPQWPAEVPETQPIQPPHPPSRPPAQARKRVVNPYAQPRRNRPLLRGGCCLVILAGLVFILLGAAYFLAPFRTNVLVLGVDSRPGEGNVGRSDTMILTTFLPQRPYIGVLSIPRDLWVVIPGYGEDRINTAHFFGEAEKAGGGPPAATQAVQQNFGVNVDYYVRLRFDGFRQVVDALGGVDVSLPSSMSGYPQGVHHLDGEQALALVRDRKGSDDFFRMERGQLFIKSLWKSVMKPTNWPRLPQALAALTQTVDTNIPVWLWPRLGLALLRLGPDGLDARAITRDMVTPFTTDGGAQVLGPRWEAINPVLMEIFDQ